MNLSIPEFRHQASDANRPTPATLGLTAAEPRAHSAAGPASENVSEHPADAPLPRASREAMLPDGSRQALEIAAAATLEKIRRDRDQVPVKLKPLLSYIEAHLFEQELSVNRMKRECGVRDNSVAIHFHACVGQPPHAYISQCRMEVASRLLADSDLPVWRISELLGFSSIQVFSRAFYRCAHLRPSTYRRRQRPILRAADGSVLAMPATAATVADASQLEQALWHRALTGQLLDDEAGELIRRLLEIYPPHRRFHA